MDRKMVQRVDPFTQYAFAAADEAVKDSAIDFTKGPGDRAGIIFGSGIGGMLTFQRQHETLVETKGPHRISPFFIPMMIADIAAGRISMKYGLKGSELCNNVGMCDGIACNRRRVHPDPARRCGCDAQRRVRGRNLSDGDRRL